jgi:hypothetical protein
VTAEQSWRRLAERAAFCALAVGISGVAASLAAAFWLGTSRGFLAWLAILGAGLAVTATLYIAASTVQAYAEARAASDSGVRLDD